MRHLKKLYYWKILSTDGLLKEPPAFGPYYDKEYLNFDELTGQRGYETELDAIKHLERFKDNIYSDDYILVPIYTSKLFN